MVQDLTAQLQARQAAPHQQAAPTAAEIFGQQSPRGDTPELVRPPDAAFFDQLIPPEAEAANHYTERGVMLPVCKVYTVQLHKKMLKRLTPNYGFSLDLV